MTDSRFSAKLWVLSDPLLPNSHPRTSAHCLARGALSLRGPQRATATPGAHGLEHFRGLTHRS